MAPTDTLVPAQDLARRSKKRFPNESAGYRAARTALLAEEIRLRRQLEQVAVQRRALPLGGEVPQDYVFEGAEGPVRLSALFGDSDTLITYNFMFGPERKQACPMCTSMLGALDGEMPDILQRVPVVIVARSPDRAPASLCPGARLAPSALRVIGRQRLQPRLCRRGARQGRQRRLQRVRAQERQGLSLLGRRDGL